MSIFDDIRKDREAGTPGPWLWEMSIRSKSVSLAGAGGDLTVMDFVRWGMSGASARFWRWSGSPRIGDPRRADELATPFSGREHHFDWCANIDDPNARRIARVPHLERIALAAEKLARRAQAVFISEYVNTKHIDGAKEYYDSNMEALAAFRAACEEGE